ncbi:GatB/YqeY domain-containing protein [Archangium lansingense]|uniref:GatB/YqeY domain-containing protein n=1 Tax=Archangium lansingense TaxID=2995310 RepID=A0ABT4AFD5_9BACT|nr:GatB/YqeY domain-containing protein [Archangium lansinium]MCY1080375.1 GatB/YqeY domain-containing protein [Archangium lansinium]
MSTVRERIDADLKDAMRSKNELNTSVLRMLKSAIKYKEVEPGATGPLDEASILQVIGTLIKQRRDSIEQFKSGGRPELAEKEEQEISVLQNYLPKQLTPDELRAEVQAAITQAGAKSSKDMGAVMKVVTPKLQGRAEGRAISEEVKNQLSKL